MLRSLLTAYDHLGLDGGAIIELLSYLKNEKGEVRLSDIKRETYQWADMGIVNAQDLPAASCTPRGRIAVY